MLASSFLDPVLGLDVHFEMVPTPVPVPTPIPNPFIGLVFDPLGLAAGIALGAVIGAVVGAPFQGPVLYWTLFPATNTGTEARHVPGHFIIPPGTVWAPFPKTPKPVIRPGETPTPGLPVKPENDAVVITGSKTVTVMGSNAVRLGDLALSCSEPLRLPSSVVLAIPKGAPILIGGPMSLDIMSAIMASLRTRFVSDSLHALVSRLSPGRLRNLLHRAVCFFTGHPVDVASGKVMTEFVDIELPGPLPLKVERIYSSAFASRPGPLGHGWSLSLDQAVWRERGKVVLLGEDGREIEFDTFDFPQHRIEAGQRVYNPIERLTLHCEKEETWRVVDHEGVTREFAPVPGRDDGRSMIQKVRSRCGYHEIGFHYGVEGGSRGPARGQLEWVRDSGGRFVHLRWDALGRVTELHLPQPHGEGFYRHRRYEYDAAGDLVQVTDSLGHAWRFAYVTHLLTQETDRNGLSFYFLYDGLGEDAWCVRTWGDGGIYDHVLRYDKRKKITYVTNSLGHTTQYHMNVVGQVVKIVDPLGGETKYEYDSVTLLPTRVVDGNSRQWLIAYDERGNLAQRTGPDGTTLELTHEHDRTTSATLSDGRAWRWTYDSSGRLTSHTDPAGYRTVWRHTGGNLTSQLEGLGKETRLSYDGQGNLALREQSGRGREQWRHDALGRAVLIADDVGALQRRHLDLEGRLRRIEEPDGNVIDVGLDAEGRIMSARDGDRRVTFTYCGRGRIATRQQGPSLLRFEYDTEDRLTTIFDEHGRSYRYELDERGQIVAEHDWGGRTRRYERDPVGQLLRVDRPAGRWQQYERDPIGRITSVTYSDGDASMFEYDAGGRLVAARNSSCAVELERDVLGRIVREHQDELWIASNFDERHDRTSMSTSMGAVVAIERDVAGNVSSLDYRKHETIWHAKYQRQAGLPTTIARPGVVEHRAYDTQHRLRRAHVVASSGMSRIIDHFWGTAFRLTARADSWGTETATFEHDERHWLIRARWADGTEEGRLPDAAGEIFRSADRRDRSYGSSGELLEASTPNGHEQREYDDEGYLLARIDADGSIWRYTWSHAGNLQQVELPDGRVVAFAYDPFSRRVTKSADGRETRFLWDGDLLACELTGSESVVAWVYEPGTDRPLARVGPQGVESVVTDHIGTPLTLYDAIGSPTWQAHVSTWGSATISGRRTHCPFRWPGQYEDEETGLHYNRFRYYDPWAGQYISPDPVRLAGGLRLYGYPLDPLVLYDFLGLGEGLVEIFRAVSQGELADINNVGFYRNAPGVSAGKYFAYTLEEAMAEARMLHGLDGGHYTVTSTLVPQRFFDKNIHHVTVDGGVRTAHIGDAFEFDLIRISKKNGVTVHSQTCP